METKMIEYLQLSLIMAAGSVAWVLFLAGLVDKIGKTSQFEHLHIFRNQVVMYFTCIITWPIVVLGTAVLTLGLVVALIRRS